MIVRSLARVGTTAALTVLAAVVLAPRATAAPAPPRPPTFCTAEPAPAPDGEPVDQAGRLRLDDLHRIATGAGQTVAVIDTGVAPGPAFGDRLRGGGDLLAGGTGLESCEGHGTAVAGVIAARPSGRSPGTVGMVGMAPDATVLSIRQSSEHLSARLPDGTARKLVGDTDTLATAIVLAVDEHADVINISEAACLPEARAVATGGPVRSALRYAVDHDVVVVAAAGNVAASACSGPAADPTQVSLPGWFDADVLAVGAVGPSDAPAAFTVPGAWVDVAAPGADVRSIGADGAPAAQGFYGTSFAAPWVSGLAALVRERYPKLSAREVMDRITATARPVPGGYGATVGHGVIDPLAALTAAPAVLAPGAGKDVRVVATLAGTAPRPPAGGPPFPYELAAMGTLLVGGIAGALRLRSR